MGRSTRTVMGDLGNNAAGSNRAGLRAKDNNAPVQKPGRTLAKQKVISVPSNNWVMATTSNWNYNVVFFLQGTASLKQVLQGPSKPVVSENVPAKPTRQLRKRSREAAEKPQPDSMEVDPLPQASCLDFPNNPSIAKYFFDPLSVCLDPTIQDPSQDVEMEVEQPVITEGFSTNKLVQFNIEDIDR